MKQTRVASKKKSLEGLEAIDPDKVAKQLLRRSLIACTILAVVLAILLTLAAILK